jgi:hypothetical protein
VSLWEERAGRNEALFREVNERVRDLAGDHRGSAEFVCECSREDCSERIHVPLAVYESVRADPRHFLVIPGHENDLLETVGERTASYLVVEKEGAAGRIADRTDPRA